MKKTDDIQGVRRNATKHMPTYSNLNYKDLLDFNSPGGYEPFGNLTYSSGMLFGATAYGGTAGYGMLFSIDTAGLFPKRMFDFTGLNGAQPEYAGGAPTIIGSVYYGTTYYGGLNDSGCIFSIDTAGNNYVDLYDFSGPQGANPEGSMTLSGTVLYGATALGGTNHVGVIYSFDTTKVTTTIHKVSVTSGQLSVYPNPSNGEFTLSIRNYKLGIRNVKIYNVLGEQVYSQSNIQNPAFNINLSNQPNGVYLYRVLNEGGNLIGEGKITIQK